MAGRSDAAGRLHDGSEPGRARLTLEQRRTRILPARCRCRVVALRLLRNIAILPCALLLASANVAAAAPDKIRIAFVGDSLAQNYVAGVARLISGDACLKGRVDIGRFARPATGLANSDYYNWPREVRRVVEAYRPNLTVISIGMNDRQGIIAPDGKHIMWGAPEWTDRYRRQIVDFLQGAAATRASVLFVGLPAMRADTFNADRVVKNRMYAEAVAGMGAANVRYLDPWKLNASGPRAVPVARRRSGRPPRPDQDQRRRAFRLRRRGHAGAISAAEGPRSAGRRRHPGRSLPAHRDRGLNRPRRRGDRAWEAARAVVSGLRLTARQARAMYAPP